MKTIRYLRPMTEYFIPKITQESTPFRQIFQRLPLKPIEIMEKNTLTNLSNLRILKIGEGTKELEEDAIENCEHLEKVYIPDSVTTIAYEESNGNVYEAFSGCPNNFVVYASAGSAGEAYARKKGLTCKDPKELFPADYSKIDELLKTVPDDSDLYRYTPDSVSRLSDPRQARSF